MKLFKLNSADKHTQPVRDMLTTVSDQIGFLPNIFRSVAESAPTLAALIELNNLFSHSSFSANEREIIQLAASVENRGVYCVAGHTSFSSALIAGRGYAAAIRENQPIENVKLEALNQFTRTLVRNRGHLSKSDIQAFLAAGYNTQNILDVILGISIKTITNLTNNLAGTPLDDEFQKYLWNSKSVGQAA